MTGSRGSSDGQMQSGTLHPTRMGGLSWSADVVGEQSENTSDEPPIVR